MSTPPAASRERTAPPSGREDVCVRERSSGFRLSPPGTVGLVGAGGFGRFVLQAYGESDDIRVGAVADPRVAGEMLATDPPLTVDSSWVDFLERPEVEALHLATPPFLRGDIVVPALRAGKSVFCEKPLALSLREADEMIRTADEMQRALGVNYVMRHHPAFNLLYRLVGSGLFGAVTTIRLQNFAQALPADHWMWDERKSGGILVEHGVHFFDAYGRLVGKPVSIRAVAPRPHSVEAEVEYEGGAAGTYYHEFAFPAEVERTHAIVFCERGYVEIDGWIPERLHGKVIGEVDALRRVTIGDEVELHRETGGAARFEASFGDRQAVYAHTVVDGMREIIARHRDPSYRMTVSLADARASLALALAGQRALHSGYSERLEGGPPHAATLSGSVEHREGGEQR